MTCIRIDGPPEVVNQVAGIIKDVVPGITDEKQYNSSYTRGDIIVYIYVQEPNQVIAGNLKDYQVIEYCRDWRSKSQVANYFSIKFEAAEEILERLTNSGDLVRELNDSGAKRHHKYEYVDATKVHLCKCCKHHEVAEEGSSIWCKLNRGYVCRGWNQCGRFVPIDGGE